MEAMPWIRSWLLGFLVSISIFKKVSSDLAQKVYVKHEPLPDWSSPHSWKLLAASQLSANTFVSQTSHWVGQSAEKLKSKEKKGKCKAQSGWKERLWGSDTGVNSWGWEKKAVVDLDTDQGKEPERNKVAGRKDGEERCGGSGWTDYIVPSLTSRFLWIF